MSSGLSSAGELLQLFRTGEVATRSELQRVTGLARSTVAPKVDALLAAGYLVEDGSIVDGRGRPSTRLRVNDQATTILVADLGATHGRLAVGTPAGEVLVESVIESNIGKGPDAVLAMVTRRARPAAEAVGAHPFQPAWRWQSVFRVRSTCSTGRIARSISMPGWDDYPVQDHLADYFGVPAVVDNDANLMGLGEQRRIYPDAHQVLFIKVGTGIGASVIIDGALLRGTDSAEGDIGHAKITGVEETCSSCGARGCLAAIASGRAMVRDLRRLGHEPPTMRDVVSSYAPGTRMPSGSSPLPVGRWAMCLSTAVSLLNPDVVVIGGDVVHAHERFLLGVRDTLLARSQPLATARLTIAPSALGDRAGIMGAAAMVADGIFGSAAVDAKIT